MSKCKCHSELVKSKAELEYTKALPVSAFQTIFGNGGSIIKYSDNVKNDAVKMAQARVKKLEVLANDPDPIK